MCGCAEPSEDWGAQALAQALYTVSNDLTRVHTLLPELSPADRCVWIIIIMWTISCLDARLCTACNTQELDTALAQQHVHEPSKQTERHSCRPQHYAEWELCGLHRHK